MEYKKKPVTIEAIEYTGNNGEELKQWSRGVVIESPVLESNGSYVQIRTLEGVMTGDIGDYIIKGVNGEFYPCKPYIFHKTYSVAGEPTALDLIAQEREKQISKGYTVEHDAKYVGETYIHFDQLAFGLMNRVYAPDGWDKKYWEELTKLPLKEKLVIAGAWIATELDIILHKEKTEQ